MPLSLLLLAVMPQTVGGRWDEPLNIVRDASASTHGWGSAVTVIGDQDGDGLSEIVIGDPLYSEPNAPRLGRIQIFSGADGSLLFEHVGLEESHFGWSVARAPDQDGDGFDDLLVGAPGFHGRDGRAVVLSPRSGSELLVLYDDHHNRSLGAGFGATVIVTSSQTEDFFIIGAPHGDYCEVDGGSQSVFRSDGTFDTGAYYCTAGANGGSALAPLPGTHPQHAGFVIRSLENFGVIGRVNIYHSVSSARFLIRGPDLGSHLATGADWNGDGFPDVAIGAAREHKVYVHDGLTAALLETYEDAASPGFPSALALIEDMDGDGEPELAIGVTGDAALGQNGEIRLYAPGVGRFRTIALSAPLAGGTLAAGSGLNADGLPCLIVGAGAPGEALSTAGAPVSMVSFRPILQASASEISAALGGSLLFSFNFGSALTSGQYRLLVSGAGTGPSWYGGLLIPLSPDVHLAATRAGQYPVWIQSPAGQLNLAGQGSCQADLPPGAIPQGLIGRSFFFAVAGKGAGGPMRAISVARAVTVIP